MAKKILIIEDDPTAADVLSEILQHHGYETFVSLDAITGAREFTLRKPDLVLLDLKIPAGGGVAVMGTIRNSMHAKNTPVIILTAADSSALKEIMAFGIQECVIKPYKTRDLIVCVQKVFGLE